MTPREKKAALFNAFCLCIDATTISYKKELLRSETRSESILWPLLTDRFHWQVNRFWMFIKPKKIG